MGAGAKSKLTPERQGIIIAALVAGNYARTACGCAGIPEGTYYRWLQQGEEATSGIYHDFSEAVKKAEAQAEEKYVKVIEDATNTTWQAAAWWLERKHFDRWGRKDRAELSTAKDQPLTIKVVYDA